MGDSIQMAHLIQWNGFFRCILLFCLLGLAKCTFSNIKCVLLFVCYQLNLFCIAIFSSTKKNIFTFTHTHTLAFHQIGPDSVVCILYCHNIRQTTTAANNILHFYVHVVHVTRTIPRSFYRLIEFRCMQIVCVFMCSMLRWFGKVGTFISDEKNLIAFGVVVLHEPRCSWQSENIYYYRFFFG